MRFNAAMLGLALGAAVLVSFSTPSFAQRKGLHRLLDTVEPDLKFTDVPLSEAINFIQDTTDHVKDALDELKKDGMKGLIVDLRDDPGGLLSAAVEISDLFVEEGKIVWFELPVDCFAKLSRRD